MRMQPWAGLKMDKVDRIEARGFILGGAVAHQVSAVSCRSARRANCRTPRFGLRTRWSTASTRWRCTPTPLRPGERVILVDDLIATGGAAEGAVKLLRQIGANVVAACFIIDLPDLGGAAKLRAMDVPVRTLMTFDGIDPREISARRLVRELQQQRTAQPACPCSNADR